MIKKLYNIFDKYILEKISRKYPSAFRFYSKVYEKIFEFINLIKYKDKYFFHVVSFEISTYCNRKCWYCPNKDNETPKEFMDFEIFKKAIAELKDIKYSGSISYNLFGEPLFDERLEDFIKYTHDNLPKCFTLLYSNGDILNIDRAKKLLDAGLDKFIITVHDKNPERNLERLKPVKEFLGHKMLLQASSDLQLSNQGGSIDIENCENKFETTKCPMSTIKNLSITKDGDIILCCKDYYRTNIMGNFVNDGGIVKVYSSYKKLRERLLKYNIADLEICKKCLGRE